MIPYFKNSKGSTRRILDLINTFRKSGSIWKSIAFVYTSKELAENKVKRTIRSQQPQKKKKY
jgi:hypothetical protein